jgi:hypothetical protein
MMLLGGRIPSTRRWFECSSRNIAPPSGISNPTLAMLDNQLRELMRVMNDPLAEETPFANRPESSFRL